MLLIQLHCSYMYFLIFKMRSLWLGTINFSFLVALIPHSQNNKNVELAIRTSIPLIISLQDLNYKNYDDQMNSSKGDLLVVM